MSGVAPTILVDDPQASDGEPAGNPVPGGPSTAALYAVGNWRHRFRPAEAARPFFPGGVTRHGMRRWPFTFPPQLWTRSISGFTRRRCGHFILYRSKPTVTSVASRGGIADKFPRPGRPRRVARSCAERTGEVVTRRRPDNEASSRAVRTGRPGFPRSPSVQPRGCNQQAVVTWFEPARHADRSALHGARPVWIFFRTDGPPSRASLVAGGPHDRRWWCEASRPQDALPNESPFHRDEAVSGRAMWPVDIIVVGGESSATH